MLGALAKMILKSKIKRDNLRRQKKFMPWEQIEKMALIIETQDSLNKSLIDKFIDDTKKHIEVFYIELQSKEPSYNDWHCFSKKDKSLWNLPAKSVESELRTKKFDAVINTCTETNLFAMSVCSSVPAYLKCGEHAGFNLADLIIKNTQPFNLKNYLDETVRYLKMIRT